MNDENVQNKIVIINYISFVFNDCDFDTLIS